MKYRITPIIRAALLVGLLASISAPARAQEQTIEPPFTVRPSTYWQKWDPVQNVLIFYRDVEDPLMPAARAYDNGTEHRPAIRPLKDFPDARWLDVWSAVATPDGGVILSCVVQYGGTNTRLVFLTYDFWGVLVKVWEMDPYHHHQLAVDTGGNVYALGDRGDRGEEATEPDYPLLIKYSPKGKVLWESLPRSQFPYGTEIVGTNSNTGEHAFFIHGDILILYLATTRELFRLSSRDGRLLTRVSLSAQLDQSAGSGHGVRGEILGLAATRSGDLVAQVRVWSTSPRSGIVGFLMVRIAEDGASWELLSPMKRQPDPGIFLGLTRSDRRLFLKWRAGEGPLLEFR